MRKRIREWLRRYLPAEILSLVATMLGAWATAYITGNDIKVALAATWAGNLVYFGTILAQDAFVAIRQGREKQYRYSWRIFGRNVRALVVEFGLAEILDSFFIRPLLMFYLPRLLGNLSAGILVAKLLADITFYIPAIISYELSKKRFRRFH